MRQFFLSIVCAIATFSVVVMCLVYLVGSKTGNFDFAFAQIEGACLKAIAPAVVSFILCYAAFRQKKRA